jgi:hypothetical protein
MFKIVLIWEKNKSPKFQNNKNPNLWLSFGSPKKKFHLDVAPVKSHIVYYSEGMVPPPKGCELCKTCNWPY